MVGRVDPNFLAGFDGLGAVNRGLQTQGNFLALQQAREEMAAAQAQAQAEAQRAQILQGILGGQSGPVPGAGAQGMPMPGGAVPMPAGGAPGAAAGGNFLAGGGGAGGFDFDSTIQQLTQAGFLDQAIKVADIRGKVQQDDGLGTVKGFVEFLNEGGAAAAQQVPGLRERINDAAERLGVGALDDSQFAEFAREDSDIQLVEQADGSMQVVDLNAVEPGQVVGAKRQQGPLVQNIVGGEAEKPITITDLQKLRLPDDTVPPFGTTPSQARELNARVVTTDEAKQALKSGAGLDVVDTLDRLALGEDGVFKGIDAGFLNRLSVAGDNAANAFTQDDPRIAEFNSFARGTLAPLIKSMGESGALAEGDVARALELVPKVFPIPDTEEVATRKLKNLRELLEKGQRAATRQAASELEQEAARPRATDPNTGAVVEWNGSAWVPANE